MDSMTYDNESESVMARGLSDDDVGAIIDNELQNCIGASESGDLITKARTRSLEYYLNDPRGDEEPGKSAQQTSDVQDVVEGLLPGTLKPFLSADRIVEFEPTNEEDEEGAEQASDYINHILMRQNPGFDIIYTWQKDAFIQKNGYVKAAWVEEEKVMTSSHHVYLPGLIELLEDPAIEVDYILIVDPLGNVVADIGGGDDLLNTLSDDARYEVRIRRKMPVGRVKVWNIPPENIVISNLAMGDASTARLVGHRELKTISELLQDGFDAEKLARIPTSTGVLSTDEASIRRRDQTGGNEFAVDSPIDPSMRQVWTGEYFINIDVDGDGIAELRKIIRAGESEGMSAGGGVILSNEPVDAIDIFSFTPIPMPHQHFGRSMSDLTMSIQDVKTVLLRRHLDSIYRSVFPRSEVNINKVTEDTWNDLLTDIPGGWVRVEENGAVSPLVSQSVAGEIQAALEYQDRIRETRTPVTRQMQGVDPNILDQTATQASLTANASEERRELILRLFANALSKLCRHILRLTVQHQDREAVFRLRNKFVTVDPRHWNADMDAIVSVGLGTGTRDQRLQGVYTILQQQQMLFQMQSPLYGPEKHYNSLARLVEMLGYTSPGSYFNDPAAPPDDQQLAMQQRQEEIRRASAQAFEEGRAAGIQQGMEDGKIKIEQAKIAADMQKHDDSMEVQLAEMAMRAGIHADKAASTIV